MRLGVQVIGPPRDGRPYATGVQHGHSPGIAVYFVLHTMEHWHFVPYASGEER